MAPALDFALLAMGIFRNFPRVLVFALEKYFGLGIPHLYTPQEIIDCQTLYCTLREGQ
jgi:hypothetical protein